MVAVGGGHGQPLRVEDGFGRRRRIGLSVLGSWPVALVDSHWAVNLLVGPLYFERLVMHRQLSRPLLKNHLDRTLDLLRQQPLPR